MQADTQVLEAEAVEADSPMLVAGELRQGSTGLSDPVINPSTGEVFAHVPHGTQDDLNEAVESAKEAYKTWSKTSYAERAACLRKYGELLATNADKLAEALSKEQGKPLAMAKMEVLGTAADCELVATEGDLEPEVTKEDDDARWELQYMPRGVIGGIAPWNFPISTAGNKIHPAVITGNTIVLKPSPYTPLATAMMSEFAAEAFPAGVVNIVTGSDDLGQMIVEHPDVAHITFTGSARTGQKIMATAAMHGLKKVTLELGGNDAAVVLPDVNPAETAPQLFQGAMFNTGQVCCAIKRVFVHESQYDEMVDALAAEAEKAKAVTGDGMEAGTVFGPINNKMQFERVAGLVDDARAEGGRIVAGGKQFGNENGYFYEPTIIADVQEGNRIVDEEQFGPVIPVIKYTDVDDAMDRANATEYGLGGSVWTNDLVEGEKRM
jgi:acyl-CoA reductase-like NAD-dependent aldehyde dehydrogenase